jgi:enoyl-CoA hydratase/carnithine racemase
MGVTYELKDRIATLTIDGRTDLNLMAPDTVYLPLYDALCEYEADDDAWCAILTGAGSAAFSAGGDLVAYESFDEGYGREVSGMLAGRNASRSLHSLFEGEVRITKPMVFAVHGLCLGAATAFVMSYADIVIAAPDAKFGLPEIKWGVGAGVAAVRLQRLLPWPIAMDVYLTGRLMGAEEGLRHGWVNEIAPKEGLMDAARAKAEVIVGNPPDHIRAVKAIMLADRRASLAAAREIEAMGVDPLFDHPDTREGIRAFVEKRKPEYTGSKQRVPTAAGVLSE